MTATATARDNRRREAQLRAAERARLARQRHRRRQAIVASVAAVVLAVGAMVGVAALTGGSSGKSAAPRGGNADGTAIARMLAETPASVVSAAGVRDVVQLPLAVKDPPLTNDGKPEVLYLGGDYCPYCAAERWGLVLAMSRFGTFTNIGLTTSGLDEVFPGTHTFSFHNSVYKSDYISFVGRELYDNVSLGRGRYQPLDTATKEQRALLGKYGNIFPLIDFGGRYVQTGSNFMPSVLKGMSAEDIAASVSVPGSPAGIGIARTANVLTAAICATTGGQPVNVCTDKAVVAATAKLRG